MNMKNKWLKSEYHTKAKTEEKEKRKGDGEEGENEKKGKFEKVYREKKTRGWRKVWKKEGNNIERKNIDIHCRPKIKGKCKPERKKKMQATKENKE